MGRSLSCCVIIFSSNIVSNSSTNELFQSRLINCIALTEIYRSRFFSIKAGIEECMRIFQESALKKVHFYCFLESADSTNKSLMRPYRGIPLPFLSHVGVGLVDKFAQPGEHLTAPVSKLCDLLVDTFRWIHVLLLTLFYKVFKSIHGFGCSFLHTRPKHPVYPFSRKNRTM